ncbi:lipase family protein [Gracilimonas sp.]|uniref:lipase family protein n=1 Tax=Gracilimonas sp. TaxID=1974203 RepID=UPI0032F00633
MTRSTSYQEYQNLAQVCKATYAGPIRQSNLGYDSQRIVHGSFGRGYCRIFWRSDHVVIAFRGTRESVDWSISNLKAFPVRLNDCGDNDIGVRVHRGFQRTLDFVDKSTGLRSLEAIWYHLTKEELLQRKLSIIGHSLGGALAILFAVKLRYMYPSYVNANLIEIVTFGSPAIGGSSFYKYYDDLHSRTVRIVNGSDAVPFTPPLWYRHVGKEIWLGERIKVEDLGWHRRLFYALNPFEIFSIVGDHSIESYINRLAENGA